MKRKEKISAVPSEGYSEAQLSAAFDLVADEDDWRLPVCKFVPADVDRDLISAAVVYYTGGMAFFSEQDDEGKLLVTSDGYYLNMVC